MELKFYDAIRILHVYFLLTDAIKRARINTFADIFINRTNGEGGLGGWTLVGRTIKKTFFVRYKIYLKINLKMVSVVHDAFWE